MQQNIKHRGEGQKRSGGWGAGRVGEESHHGLGQVLDKLLQRGALQDLEDGVLDLLLVVHVVALMTTELVLGDHLARGVGRDSVQAFKNA